LPETVEPEASAAELETSTDRFELLVAPRGAPDDLAKLTGVGPQIVKKLNEHGVFHYWQLAAMTPEETAKLDADLRFNGRIARDKCVVAAPMARHGRLDRAALDDRLPHSRPEGAARQVLDQRRERRVAARALEKSFEFGGEFCNAVFENLTGARRHCYLYFSRRGRTCLTAPLENG